MKPVDQRRTDDCMRAAVASIFELPYEDVPLFGGESDDRQKDNGFAQDRDLRAWLKARGAGLRYVHDPAWQMKTKKCAELPWGLCVGSGKSPRGDWQHAVVCRALDNFEVEPCVEIVHDPHPSRAGIDGTIQTYHCFLLLDPVRLRA